jgi:hypothetical protein
LIGSGISVRLAPRKPRRRRMMMEKRMTLSFDVSAAAFVVRCFGLRIVDGKLKRPRALNYEDVTCAICNKVIKTAETVGGFFEEGKPEPSVCCNSTICLLEAVEKSEARDG